MNFDEIKELIKLVSKTGIGKVQVEKEDCKVTISGSRAPKEQAILVQPQQQVVAPPPPQSAVGSAPYSSEASTQSSQPSLM